MIMVSQPHNSKLTIELLKDFKIQQECAHNSKLTIELLKDFNYNKNMIMVSQPHNSEVTMDNLQVLKPMIQIN